MKSISNLVFLLLLLLFSGGCKLLKVIEIVSKESILEKDYYYVIPFENKDNMIIVKVNIKGNFYNFIFDTGAFTVLSDNISDTLKLIRISGPRILDSQGNKQTIDFTVPDTISLDRLYFINAGCGIYNFRANPELSCFAFDGILGANMFKQSVVQVNFKTNTLIITDDIRKIKLSDTVVKFHFYRHITGQPIVKMKIDGVKINNVILDYGSGAGFNLSSSKLIKKIQKNGIPCVRYHGANAVGLFGKNSDESTYYRAKDIQIESMNIDPEVLVLSKDGISTIGVEFLKNYIVSLDFKNRMVYFDTQTLEEMEGVSTFGLTPVLSEGKLIVSGLFIPSPAIDAGIKEGDRILRVDGHDFSAITQDEYCDILKNGIFTEGKDTTEITLISEGKTKTLTLIKKDLLK